MSSPIRQQSGWRDGKGSHASLIKQSHGSGQEPSHVKGSEPGRGAKGIPDDVLRSFTFPHGLDGPQADEEEFWAKCEEWHRKAGKGLP